MYVYIYIYIYIYVYIERERGRERLYTCSAAPGERPRGTCLTRSTFNAHNATFSRRRSGTFRNPIVNEPLCCTRPPPDIQPITEFNVIYMGIVL